MNQQDILKRIDQLLGLQSVHVEELTRGMSKHNRTEVLKVLKQQMEAASDPKEKVELAKQIAKLLPRPRQARRPRKLEATPINILNHETIVLRWTFLTSKSFDAGIWAKDSAVGKLPCF